MLSEVKYLIEKFNLKPHPEGGYFSENYRSEETFSYQPERFNGEHVFKTSIYYLLEKENVSMFHRLKQDELWHHYTGCDVVLHLLVVSTYLRIYCVHINEKFVCVVNNV